MTNKKYMTESLKIINTMFGKKEKDPELCNCMCHDDPESTKHMMPCCKQCDKCKKHIDGLFWEKHVINCQLSEDLKKRIEAEINLFEAKDDGKDLKRDALHYEYLHKGAFVGDEQVMDNCLLKLKKLNED